MIIACMSILESGRYSIDSELLWYLNIFEFFLSFDFERGVDFIEDIINSLGEEIVLDGFELLYECIGFVVELLMCGDGFGDELVELLL